MIQRKKNVRLLIILSAIVIIIALLPILKNSDDSFSVDKTMFTLNQQTVITDVNLLSDSLNNKLSYVNGKWKVNDTYDLDPNMRDVFFSVLSQLEIRRAVPASQNDSIAKLNLEKGVQVTILNNQELIKKYWVIGNSESQTSYLTDEEGQSYIIHIPGYRSYVAGIFEVPESDWRNRRVFSALFTNLNTLKITYSDEEIEFSYKDQFFEITGMQADSAQLIGALENLLFLQTDQYLNPSEYSSYIDTGNSDDPPLFNITLTKLSGVSETVSIYDTANPGALYLGKTPDGSFCLFNKNRLNKILVKKSDFE